MGMRTFFKKKNSRKHSRLYCMREKKKKKSVLNPEAANCVRHKKKALSVNCAFIFKVCSAQGGGGDGHEKNQGT